MIIKNSTPAISQLLQAQHVFTLPCPKVVGHPDTVSYSGEDYDAQADLSRRLARRSFCCFFLLWLIYKWKGTCKIYTFLFFFFFSFFFFFLIPCCMHLIIWDRLTKYRANKTFRKWYFPLTFLHFVLIIQLTAFLYEFVWQNETGTIIFRPRKCNPTQRK